MLRDIEGSKGAVAEFTEVYDCGVNVFGLPILFGAMKTGEGEPKECLNTVSCVVGKGKRGLFEVLCLT
jgi:hypothetical protein